MRPLLLLFGIAIAVTALAPRAQAQNYPWCALYGGSGMGNMGEVEAAPVPAHGRHFSLLLTLPPLSTLFFVSEAGR